MGGLIGSLYSLGYQPEQMDSILRSFDWDVALTDKVPRDYISYATSKYKEKILLSFPFYYAKKDYVERMEENIQYTGTERKYDQIHFGAAKGEDATRVVRDNLLGSLPSGFAFGQNVNNIFSSLTVGYQDNMSFEELPIPFVCVATEMVTAKPKIWYEGKLNTALRSTMSIPGVFAPVKTDGMVLVDGGMRDNYPTDIAKAMGADIIIGVDLSSGFRQATTLHRTLLAGYNSICLPMTLSAEQLQQAAPGVQLERLAKIQQNGNTLTLVFLDCTAEGLQAGTPYLIFSPKLQTLRATSTNAKAVSTQLLSVTKTDAAGNQVTFGSSWESLRVEGRYGIPAQQEAYPLQSILVRTDADKIFLPTRCGFTWDKQAVNATDIEIKHVTKLDGTETSIEKLQAENAIEDVYDTQGNLVMKQTNINTALQSLPRGIYVVRGQKVAVK